MDHVNWCLTYYFKQLQLLYGIARIHIALFLSVWPHNALHYIQLLLIHTHTFTHWYSPCRMPPCKFLWTHCAPYNRKTRNCGETFSTHFNKTCVTRKLLSDSCSWNTPKAAKYAQDVKKREREIKFVVPWSNANESLQINCILPP